LKWPRAQEGKEETRLLEDLVASLPHEGFVKTKLASSATEQLLLSGTSAPTETH